MERTNKEIGKIVKKAMFGATQQWELWLPMVQLALNTRVQERTNSSPFALLHGRPFNGFNDFSNVLQADEPLVSLDKFLAKRKMLRDVILPGVRDRLKEYRHQQKIQFERRNKIVDPFKIGDRVWSIDPTRESKWDPVYEGPYTIVKIHEDGSYTLRDATGDELDRKVATHMLKRQKSVDSPPGNRKAVKETESASKAEIAIRSESLDDKGKDYDKSIEIDGKEIESDEKKKKKSSKERERERLIDGRK